MGERWIWNLYHRILYYLRGVISMIHLHNLINMSIAPPPEWPLNEVNFEEGVYKHLPPKEEGAF